MIQKMEEYMIEYGIFMCANVTYLHIHTSSSANII